MRQRPDPLILIAVYEFVMAAMLLIASCVVLPIALLITPFASHGFGQFVARFFFVALALIVVFGFGVASAVVGFGLLMLKEWARIGAMLLAIPALVIFPIWTVIAILILVYLAGEDGRALFRHSRRAGMASARAFREEAGDDDLGVTVNPPKWDPSPDIPRYDPPDGSETIFVRDQPDVSESITVPDEPRQEVSWVEPVTEANGLDTGGEEVKKPPLD